MVTAMLYENDGRRRRLDEEGRRRLSEDEPMPLVKTIILVIISAGILVAMCMLNRMIFRWGNKGRLRARAQARRQEARQGQRVRHGRRRRRPVAPRVPPPAPRGRPRPARCRESTARPAGGQAARRSCAPPSSRARRRDASASTRSAGASRGSSTLWCAPRPRTLGPRAVPASCRPPRPPQRRARAAAAGLQPDELVLHHLRDAVRQGEDRRVAPLVGRRLQRRASSIIEPTSPSSPRCRSSSTTRASPTCRQTAKDFGII